ncbi:MAG: hypothetical protein J1F18_00630 [Lachnospiraceae bacterium]|nr:hypothetical protein [Lachnospiraceae bacterium]
MNVIFTIVAKNYLASAITLGKSVRKYNADCDFIIFLSDKSEGIVLDRVGFPVYEVEKFSIPNLEQQIFMYDVVEFSTAVKPFFMLYLMNEKKYDKVIYLDPDIWVMDSLDFVFEQLDKWDFVLTPHIVDMNSAPNEKETHILDRGVFNLGFLAARNSNDSQNFLHWWKKRLEIYCFRDNRLFVDQKWVGYLPIFSDNYYVMRSKAYNIADWNYHERDVIWEDERYFIKDGKEKESLKLFHFSGIKLETPAVFFRKHGIKISDDKCRVLSKIILEYQKELVENGYEIYSKLPYAYGSFSNGDTINLFHRRIYKKYKDYLSNPFSVTDGNFYKILKKEKLISKRKEKKKIHSENVIDTADVRENVGQTFIGRVFIIFMKLLIRIIGIDGYINVLKQLQVGVDINEQSFLISKHLSGKKDCVGR